MTVVARSRALADELGVLDTAVFFNDSWVPYEERASYLVEADAGVSTHFRHVETTFSFRTRILDYLWAGLPMVVTEGDSFADLVATEDLGVVVPERDVEALATALEAVLFDDERRLRWRANVARVRERFAWSSVLEPLVEFCASPRRAPDSEKNAITHLGSSAPPRGMRRDLGLLIHHLRYGGIAVVTRKIRRRLAR